MSETAYKCFEIDDKQHLLKTAFTGVFELDKSNAARQAFPKTYHPNGYVDILRVDFIEHEGRLHGGRVLPFVTEYAPEVDSPADFDYLEYHLSRNVAIIDTLFG